MALSGFRYLVPSTPKGRKGGGGGKTKGKITDSQAVSVYTKMLGADPTINQIEAVQANLAQNPSDEAQIANIDLETKKQDLIIKKQKSAHSTQSYDDRINDNKKEFLLAEDGKTINSPSKIAGGYGLIYSRVAIDYQRNVIDKAIQKGTDTPEMREYQKKLQDKADFYNGIYQAANKTDADGKVGAFANLGIVAVPTINPSDNSIQGMDFMTSQDAAKNKNLMLTDTGIQSTDGGGRIPMALPVSYFPDPTNPKNLAAQAFLGNAIYSGARVPLTDDNGNPVLDGNGEQKYSTTDQLRIQGADKDPAMKDALTNGISLKASLGVKADTSGKPAPGTVTTRGGKVYFTDENGKTQYAPGDTLEDSTNNMKTYLSFLGKDPNKLMPSALLTAPSGTDPNMIDMSVTKPHDVNQFLHSQSAYTATPGAPTSQPQQSSFFAAKQSAPAPEAAPAPTPTSPEAANKPNAPKESVGGKSWVTDIVAKGAKFFAGQA